ncbi:MAG: S8 family serine peptidase [Oligoflexia bacterium]|nr:S8 family serine peptidase [Oligoflexia bacterium]
MKKSKKVLRIAFLLFSAISGPNLQAVETGRGSETIPGRFIVTLKSDVSARDVAHEHRVAPDRVYRNALQGFAGALSDSAREGLLRDARVARIEPDVRLRLFQTQGNPTWSLDRIDQRALPLDASYSSPTTGSGVRAYILDTGIRMSHADFGGRASFGFDAFGGDGSDCNGHGTHVSGTVGGAAFGVAKGVSLVAVRVLDCAGSGSLSGVLAGIDWVIANRALPAVANLSLGGSANSTLDTAIQRLIAAGVATSVAAGNDGRDACRYSPSRVPEAMTIGASDRSDTKASWSNLGDCVDFFAPGVSITSAWNGSDSGTNTISGTSMAAPHAAGAAALLLELDPGATPASIRDTLFAATTKNVILSANTVNNHLLYVSGEATPPDLNPPTVSITAPATGSVVPKRSLITLSASASDAEGPVTRVEFFIGTTRACVAQAAPFSCSWKVPNGPSRTFSLTARAFDASGNVGVSEPIEFSSR